MKHFGGIVYSKSIILKTHPIKSLDVIVFVEIFISELPMNFQSLKVGMVKSDLCRLVMLYNIGGLYFDTDSNVGEMMWLYMFQN